MLLLNMTICLVRARRGRSRQRNVSTAFDDTASCIAGPGGSTDCPTPTSGP